jgi:hypothetical protein
MKRSVLLDGCGLRDWLALALLATAAVACRAAPDEAVEVTQLGEAGELMFELSMDRVVEGPNELELWVRDPGSRELVDVELSVDALHVEMGHGSEVQPEISRTREGGYFVSGLSLSMPGRWSVFVDAQAATVSDRLQFDVVVR